MLCNIAIIATIGNVFAALLAGAPASGVVAGAAAAGVAGAAAFDARAAMTLAMLIIVRAIAIYAAQRAGDKAAFAAKRQVRQLVYDKLVQMGPAYTEQVSTAEAVQTSVEGAQQLEVYFGGYLPQLFYAVLAPVTLFAAPPRALRWRCCSWRPAPSAGSIWSWRKAAFTSLIARLPQGYDTPVAELGDSLSGGERQRIGLARIFLHDAPFVLLDEPTSNLDALNEAAVMRAIDRRRAGKTVVLVSHRASTCAFADRFYSVEHGRIS